MISFVSPCSPYFVSFHSVPLSQSWLCTVLILFVVAFLSKAAFHSIKNLYYLEATIFHSLVWFPRQLNSTLGGFSSPSSFFLYFYAFYSWILCSKRRFQKEARFHFRRIYIFWIFIFWYLKITRAFLKMNEFRKII